MDRVKTYEKPILPIRDEKATKRLMEQAIASTIEVTGRFFVICESSSKLTKAICSKRSLLKSVDDY